MVAIQWASEMCIVRGNDVLRPSTKLILTHINIARRLYIQIQFIATPIPVPLFASLNFVTV